MRIRSKKGFTLAEMLIVVAIVAILLAIAFPVFSESLEEARRTTDRANFRAAESAAAIFKLQGEIVLGDGSVIQLTDINSSSGQALYYLKDGTFAVAPKTVPPENAYRSLSVDQSSSAPHEVGYVIQIIYNPADGVMRTQVAWHPGH